MDHSSSKSSSHTEDQKEAEASFVEFVKQFEALSSPEEKLRKGLHMMRHFIAQKENLPFKEFWEIRKLCIPLFKENVALPTRNQLWEDYIELTREGRELKNILDQEANFAAEQIEIAIKALEDEIDLYHEKSEEALAKYPSSSFPQESKALQHRYQYYIDKQHALNFLNAHAERINSLRKELIKTAMRFRFKNKFFQRLSALGDKVFPKRRDLIRDISTAFEEDVTNFVHMYFSTENFSYEKVKRSVFFFRDEIKILQAFAKVLTINTHAFTLTREELSKCWDKLKGMEKELKKEYSQQKHQSEENAALIRIEIESIKKSLQENSNDEEKVLDLCDGLLRKMRDCDLTRHDVLALKEEIRLIKEPLLAKKEDEERQRKEKEAAFEEKRRKEVEALRDHLEKLKEKLKTASVSDLLAELQSCQAAFSVLSLSKKERSEIERTLKRLSQEIEEKKEEALLVLSDDDRKVLDNFTDILNQRKERRFEIKKQIDEYRKILGGSSLDIGKAIEYNELISAEKERLEKIDESIGEIERKIRELKKR